VNFDEPIATGRDADIFDAGPGRVLRRSRKGHSQALEAKVMEYVVAHGYPAPTVYEVSDDGLDMVMQRVDGPTMLEDLGDHPWRLVRHAHTLADLHTQLGRIPAPDWLRAGPVPGDRVVHLDLHPLNVLLTPDGPVVIDWTNAASGTAGSDVALTWLLTSSGRIPGPRWKATLFGAFRRVLMGSFIRRAGRDAALRDLPAMAEWKSRDANMSADELAAMRSFVARNT
jgi:aminoglycoside phosphotransferase (APT) family kinase protein